MFPRWSGNICSVCCFLSFSFLLSSREETEDTGAKENGQNWKRSRRIDAGKELGENLPLSSSPPGLERCSRNSLLSSSNVGTTFPYPCSPVARLRAQWSSTLSSRIFLTALRDSPPPRGRVRPSARIFPGTNCEQMTAVSCNVSRKRESLSENRLQTLYPSAKIRYVLPCSRLDDFEKIVFKIVDDTFSNNNQTRVEVFQYLWLIDVSIYLSIYIVCSIFICLFLGDIKINCYHKGGSTLYLASFCC